MRLTDGTHSPSSATSRPLASPKSNHSPISTSPKFRCQRRWPCPISPNASSSTTDTTCSCMASQARAKHTSPLPSASRRANCSKRSPSIASPTSFNAFGMPQPPKTPASSNASPSSTSSFLTSSAIRHAIPTPSSSFSTSSPTSATKRKASFSRQTALSKSGSLTFPIPVTRKWLTPPSTASPRILFCSRSSANRTEFCSPN